jgi:hypothetical protein
MVPESNCDNQKEAKRLATQADKLEVIMRFILRDISQSYTELIDGKKIILFAIEKGEKRLTRLAEHICLCLLQAVHPKTDSIHGSMQAVRDKLTANFEEIELNNQIIDSIISDPDLYMLANEYVKTNIS